MLNLRLLSVLLTIVFGVMGSEMDKFLGPITPVAMFPKPLFTRCQSFNFQKINDQVKCTCGDKTDLSQYSLHLEDHENGFQFVPIVVDSSSEVAAATATIKDCTCGGDKRDRIIFRPINDNYFMHYNADNKNKEDKRPYIAILYFKNAPKKSEFEKFIATVDDFARWNYTLLCDSLFSAE